MLVEPGMLLIYRSADKQPKLTDMLVEYLYDYAYIYDPSRSDEAFLSIQRVMQDCEQKGVVQSIKSNLINHRKLQVQTQDKLKRMYTASQRQKQGQTQNKIETEFNSQTNDAVMIDTGFADGRASGLERAADEFDGNMIDDDLNMSGQFSPPHEPNTQSNYRGLGTDKMRGGALGDTEQDSAYVDEVFGKDKTMPKSPNYEVEEAAFSSQSSDNSGFNQNSNMDIDFKSKSQPVSSSS